MIYGKLGNKIDQGNTELGGKIDGVNSRMDTLATELGNKIDQGNTELGTRVDRVNSRIDQVYELLLPMNQ